METMMDRGAIQTRDWTAEEIPDFAGRLIRIKVQGQVQVTETSEVPHLHERKPQGINPKILELDLTLVRGGIGGQIVFFRGVEFHHLISRRQYSTVEIFFEGQRIETIEVGEVIA